jgi:hypothetical protein
MAAKMVASMVAWMVVKSVGMKAERKAVVMAAL